MSLALLRRSGMVEGYICGTVVRGSIMVLKLTGSTGLANFAYRVTDPEELDKLAWFLRRKTIRSQDTIGLEKGQDKAVKV